MTMTAEVASPVGRILVVEDDPSILLGLRMNLSTEGYEVGIAEDGRTGLERVLGERWDVVILDVMLPKLNGFEVVKHIRAAGDDTKNGATAGCHSGGYAVLSVKECAEHATVCESVVRGWITSGLLPHYRLGLPGKRGKIVILIEDLNRLIASFKVERKRPEAIRPPAQKSPTSLRLRHLRLPS